MQTHIQTPTHALTQFVKAEREYCSQKAKTKRMFIRERKKEEKKEGLNAEGRLGAFLLALTGEINHHNYGPAQVNGDRSPLSFPSSRCFLLIRTSQALLPTDPWPMRSKFALDARGTLGTS